MLIAVMSAAAASLPCRLPGPEIQKEVRAVVHVQAADVIPADIDIEPVVLHRVLDDHEVLAGCKVIRDPCFTFHS